MKTAISKQAALKAMLLLVLAANVNWKLEPTLHSYDAAQESAPATSGGRIGGTVTVSPSPDAVPTRARTTEGQATTTAAPAPNSANQNRLEVPMNICGEAVLVRFERMTDTNKTRETVIRKYPTAQVLVAHEDEGSFETNALDVEGRRMALENLQKIVTPKIASCAQTAAAPVAAGSLTPSAQQQEEDKRKLADDVKNCKKGSDGKRLDSATRLACNQERLADVESFDEDDRAAKSKARSQFNEIVNQIQEDLRKQVKLELVEGGDKAAARELVKEATDAIAEAGGDIGISPAVISSKVHALNSMFAAMVSGAELKEISEAKKVEFESLRAQMEMERTNLQIATEANDPWAKMMAEQRLNQMNSINSSTNQQFLSLTNPYIAGLRRAEAAHYITSTDVMDFTRLYDELKRGYSSVGGSATTVPTSLTPPTNLMQARQQAHDQFQQQYGVSIPQRPAQPGVPVSSVFTSGDPRLGGRRQ